MQHAEPKKHRLHALCPYFAMFPETFARENILETTKAGDLVFDPFSGRGTTLLEALLNDRRALASDINPVAYVVSGAKAAVPSLAIAERRLTALEEQFETERARRKRTHALPPFFSVAFAPKTLRQILFLRRSLQWRTNGTDKFIAAVLLGHLHGESDRSETYLSAQMPHTISPKPDYALRFWKRKKTDAPARDVFDLLRDRITYRLEFGRPAARGVVARVDARKTATRFSDHLRSVKAVVTSPPYLDVTSFEEDQWLRLWFLGGKPQPTYNTISHDDRHRSTDKYFEFLTETWKGIAPLMAAKAHLVCRIGSRRLSAYSIRTKMVATVKEIWPKAVVVTRGRETELRRRQTNAFRGGTSDGCGVEFDFVFQVPS